MIAQPPYGQSSLQEILEWIASTTVMMPSALYKPLKKHEQGTHTYTLILSHKWLELSLFDLSFGGACLDHLSRHPFVQRRSSPNFFEVGQT